MRLQAVLEFSDLIATPSKFGLFNLSDLTVRFNLNSNFKHFHVDSDFKYLTYRKGALEIIDNQYYCSPKDLVDCACQMCSHFSKSVANPHKKNLLIQKLDSISRESFDELVK